MKKLFLPILISTFFISHLAKSQGNCGTYDGYLQDEMNKYPLFYNSIKDKNIELEKKSKQLTENISEKENTGEKKIIPVVVHIIHDFGPENITDNDVHYALEQLNKNINRQADNMLTTPDVFAAVAGSANVEFRLAKLAPKCDSMPELMQNGDTVKDENGNILFIPCPEVPTNGIVRIHSKLTDVPEPRDIVKTLSYWNSYEYFNIWVVSALPSSDGNTLLGYAQFPWSGSMSTDGVAIRSSEFKNGRTLTHEVGHWLGLRHTWGDALCGDDNVFDTPVAKEENWGVQLSDFPHNVNVCVADSINPAGEMFVNYMDYSPDQVTSMFTDGQMVIVNQTLEGDEENQPFRKYLWSAENLEKTGTSNGYVGTPCNKKPNFIEKYGNTTNCLGEVSVLSGNKNIFNNGLISIEWNWGDGNTSNTSNTPQHTYSAAGTYDVSLTVEYIDNVIAKSWNMDDVQAGYTLLETITETKIIEGTMEELSAVSATNITLHLDDSNYSVTMDTLFYRGEYEETYFLAHYESTCTSVETKEEFITILPATATNTNDSYTYSFEGTSLEDDFLVVDNKLVADWDFNVSENPHWELVSGISSDGNSCIMLNGKKLTSANPVIFETQSYNLSDLTEPAISFDFIGAAVNSFPYNTLLVSYSDECGTWKDLKLFSPEELASAGYYPGIFPRITDDGSPEELTWNTAVMFDEIGSNDLKSPNVRFKFEYQVSSLVNRLYIDNIKIGEAADLSLSNSNISERFSFYPNPTNNNLSVIFELAENRNIEVKIYNVLGKEISTLISNNMEEGYHSLDVDLGNVDSGLYFVSIISEGVVIETKSLVVQ